MVEVVLVVAVVLLVAGVVGSVVPMLPSGLLALAGVYVYVFFGAEPIGPLVLLSLTLAGLLAVVLEHLGGPIAARATGASNETTVAATIAGVLCLFILGPVGIVVGVLGAVFVLELRRGAALDIAARRSFYTGLGVLASSVAQVILTLSILGLFVAFVVF
ncbi:DUF456 domain-containing protein [Haloferacaceae archaeon DSL9]